MSSVTLYNKLPRNILCVICSSLSLREHFLVFNQVCRSFNEASRGPLSFPSSLDVASLWPDGLHGITDQVLLALARYDARPDRLKLHLRHGEPLGHGLAFLGRIALEGLSLSAWGERLTPAMVASVVSQVNGARLGYLSCQYWTLDMQKFQNLRCVKLYSPVREIDVQSLAHLPLLETLSASVHPRAFSLLPRLKSLTDLNLFVALQARDAVIDYSFLAELRLTRFKITDFARYNRHKTASHARSFDNSCVLFLQQSPLTSLRTHWCLDGAALPVIVGVSAWISSLQSLTIETGTRLSNQDIHHLKALTNLQRLHIRSDQLSDNGLRHLAPLQSLTDLTYGNNCTGYGLQHIQHLPLVKLRLLASLNKHIDKQVLAFLLPLKKTLRRVHLDLRYQDHEGKDITTIRRLLPDVEFAKYW